MCSSTSSLGALSRRERKQTWRSQITNESRLLRQRCYSLKLGFCSNRLRCNWRLRWGGSEGVQVRRAEAGGLIQVQSAVDMDTFLPCWCKFTVCFKLYSIYLAMYSKKMRIEKSQEKYYLGYIFCILFIKLSFYSNYNSLGELELCSPPYSQLASSDPITNV